MGLCLNIYVLCSTTYQVFFVPPAIHNLSTFLCSTGNQLYCVPPAINCLVLYLLSTVLCSTSYINCILIYQLSTVFVPSTVMCFTSYHWHLNVIILLVTNYPPVQERSGDPIIIPTNVSLLFSWDCSARCVTVFCVPPLSGKV